MAESMTDGFGGTCTMKSHQPADRVLKGKRVEFRIEALRAASRIVADMAWIKDEGTSSLITLELAEQFARWLEDGKR